MTYLVVLLVIFTNVWCFGADQSPETKEVKDMKQEYLQINKRLKTFNKSKDLEELEKIWQTIPNFGNANIKGEQESKQVRDMKLKLWFSFINNIDKHLDPNFNSDDVPQINIAPPSSNDVVYDSGMSPDSIKDPKIRVQYEEAIKQNTQKAAQHRFQIGIRRINERWYLEVIKYIKEKYLSNPEDTKEINKSIDTCILDAKRKEQIKKDLESKQKK